MDVTTIPTEEKAMRDYELPKFESLEELTEFIQALQEQDHDYGTCCYAMSLAATATFNYMAGQLGCTGFQASCADMDILKRTRMIKGPFMIIKGEEMLYPQMNPKAKLQEALDSWKEWAKEEVTRLLKESPGASPNVIAHWKTLAR